MKALIKTLIGDWRTVLVVAISLGASVAVLKGPVPEASGYLLPVLLLGGASWLARH